MDGVCKIVYKIYGIYLEDSKIGRTEQALILSHSKPSDKVYNPAC